VSVMRHTGKWERTPFAGSVDEVMEIIIGPFDIIRTLLDGDRARERESDDTEGGDRE